MHLIITFHIHFRYCSTTVTAPPDGTVLIRYWAESPSKSWVVTHGTTGAGLQVSINFLFQQQPSDGTVLIRYGRSPRLSPGL